jgi:Tol biopolymer transport system component
MDVLVYNLQSTTTELVSVQNPAITSQSPDGQSVLASTAAVSLNGRYVAFASDADNLVANDTNGYRDVFVRDLISGTNILASANTNGLPASGVSSEQSISSDGRYVVFSSSAADLVSGDSNNSIDVFERDLQNGTTTLVSINMNGTGPGNSNSYSPVVSGNGRFVLYQSQSRNLTTGSFGSGVANLFLRDMQLGTNYALTAASSGISALFATITPDEHFVEFSYTNAGPAPGVFIWDLQLAGLVYTNSTSFQAAISPDGQKLAYSAATGLFILDRANPTNNAKIATGNFYIGQWSGNFSSDGNLFAFYTSVALASTDTNAVNDIYLYDVLAKTNFLVSHNLSGTGVGDGASDEPVISPDGRFVAYRSAADNLVPGDNNGVPDVFIYDRTAGSTTLLTANQSGNGSAGNRSLLPQFSGDGQTLVFESAASDLVTNDWNRASDVFAFNFYFAGMIPTFYVQASPVASPAQNPTLIWPVQSGKSYQVQFKNNLSDPAWQTLPGNVTILGSTAYFTDPTPVSGQRFYQIVGQ